MIKAPFNFVPPNDEFFHPDWTEKISHDIPFKEGMSGFIDLKIEAKTPIFVRNGHVKNAIDNDFSHYTRNGRKQYFIPATSIKGMIRNVFEANSFCKMKPVNDSKFPYRDVSESTYRNKIENALCGFLKKEASGKYVLSNRGKPGRISMMEISTGLYNHFCARNVSSNESGSSAKYEFVNRNKIKLPHFFKEDKEHNQNRPSVDNRFFYTACNESEKGALSGKIVFTGQNSIRSERSVKEINLKKNGSQYQVIGDDTIKSIRLDDKYRHSIDSFIDDKLDNLLDVTKKIPVKYYLVNNNQSNREWRFSVKDGRIILTEVKAASGKAFEFIFFNEVISTYDLYISDNCVSDFFAMYKYSPDFKDYLAKRLESGEDIPVFFTLNNHQIENIGLSYMFKYPYQKSVHKAINCIHRSEEADLGEVVFGSIENSLKGRVRFTHAKLETNVNENREEVSLILSNPRASYYPIYLQSGKWDAPGKIKGRKRYLIYHSVMNTNGEGGNTEMQSVLTPLPVNSRFSSRIYFHNLNKIELGALLSAILFHENKDCFHNLGAAKPFGYGKIKVEIKGIKKASLETNELETYPKSVWLQSLVCFEEEMDQKLGFSWRESSQIENLYLMAREIPHNELNHFRYMQMNMDNQGDNEFLIAKKERLPYYANIINQEFDCINLDFLIEEAKIEDERITEEAEMLRIEEENRLRQQENALQLGKDYSVGDEIDIVVTSPGKPKLGLIEGSSVEVQIVTKSLLVLEQIIKCEVKQKSKDGRITQVGYK